MNFFEVESKLVAGVEVVVAPVVDEVSALAVDGHRGDVVDGGLHWHVGELVLAPLVLRAGAYTKGNELPHEHLEVLIIVVVQKIRIAFMILPMWIQSLP